MLLCRPRFYVNCLQANQWNASSECTLFGWDVETVCRDGTLVCLFSLSCPGFLSRHSLGWTCVVRKKGCMATKKKRPYDLEVIWYIVVFFFPVPPHEYGSCLESRKHKMKNCIKTVSHLNRDILDVNMWSVCALEGEIVEKNPQTFRDSSLLIFVIFYTR